MTIQKENGLDFYARTAGIPLKFLEKLPSKKDFVNAAEKWIALDILSAKFANQRSRKTVVLLFIAGKNFMNWSEYSTETPMVRFRTKDDRLVLIRPSIVTAIVAMKLSDNPRHKPTTLIFAGMAQYEVIGEASTVTTKLFPQGVTE